MGFELMNAHKFEINTVPGTQPGTLALLAKGVKNVEVNNNEELAQDKYLDGGGFGRTDVIGAQTILTFTADRDYEDAAQNFIFGLLLKIGKERETDFVWTEPDGGKFDGDITVANITPPSGDAGAKGECSWEIHFNGKPNYTEAV